MWLLLTRLSRARNLSSSILKPSRRYHTTKPSSPIAPTVSRTLGSRLVAPLSAYRRAAQTRPYIVQFSTSLLVWFTGDVLAQSIEQSSQPTSSWDIPRTLRALAIGAGAAIPLYHWHMFLGNLFTTLPRWTGIAARVATQQAIFPPVFNTYFFFTQAVLNGATAAEGAARVRAALITSWVNSMRIWPAVTAVNFAFVPPELRSLVPGLVAVGWQCYLSILNQRTARLLVNQGHEAQVA